METLERRFGAAIRRKKLDAPAHLWPALLYAQPYRPPSGTAAGPKALVFANQGRWLARCPFCPSCQHADGGDVFYCADCQNAEAGGSLVPLVWPKNRQAIEAQLAKRPLREARNWHPGETIADLKRQDADAVRGLGG